MPGGGEVKTLCLSVMDTGAPTKFTANPGFRGGSRRELSGIFTNSPGFARMIANLVEVPCMAKKRISDTTTGAVLMFQSAMQGTPEPPEGLPAAAADYWCSIISTRPGADWDGVALALVEQAAWAMADIAALRATLAAEGAVTEAGRPHPAAQMLDGATKRQLALLRALGLSAGDSRDNAQRDKAFRQARRVVAELDDDLLAH